MQEALTNAMRHEGLVPTRVEVDLRGDEVAVTVTNPTAATGAAERPSGRGLLGMRERATALGGSFDAGACGGDYVVRAALPLRALS